jgi:hypothetical protein
MMVEAMSAKLSAFLVHLLISACLLALILMLVFLFWYPGPLFGFEDGWGPLRILIIVDMIVGPMLTLMVFRPGKPGLVMDMTIIAILQLSALGLGSYTLWSQRPMVLAFSADSFQVVSAGDLGNQQVPAHIWQDRPWAGPLPVFVAPKGDPAYLLKILFEGAPDVYLLPEQYRKIDEHLDALQERSLDLPALAESNATIAAAIAGVAPELLQATLALPVHGRLGSGTVLVDPQTGWPVRYLDFDVELELAEMRRNDREADRDARQLREDEQRALSTSP